MNRMPKGPLALPALPRAPELVWRVPGSKSITNRALVLAALAEGESRLEGVLHSDDTRHMREGLAALGIRVHDAGPTTLVVEGGRSRLRAPAAPLFVGNSGTTVRFLTALAALVDGSVTLTCDEAMSRRPLQDQIDGTTIIVAESDDAHAIAPNYVWGPATPSSAEPNYLIPLNIRRVPNGPRDNLHARLTRRDNRPTPTYPPLVRGIRFFHRSAKYATAACRRDFTVPSGIPRISLISLYGNWWK